jgi:CRP/FNR family transcriptional regulator
VHFALPFTRAEMADYLGLTLETVSRQFSRLKAKGIIALPSSRDITIPDVEHLSGVAQMESCSSAFDDSQSRVIA